MVLKTNLGGSPYIPPTVTTDAPPVVNGATGGKLDGLDGPSGSLFGTNVGAKPVEAKLTGNIATQFPIDDLGSIATHGRWATGFSLDGGSVRLMWISARRVNDAADKRGFEISFFLQGPSIGLLKERMEKKGATATTLPYYGAQLAPNAAPGQDTLVRDSSSWSPGGSAIMVHVDDKYTVHLVESQPEALKGAVRIRVYGDDAQSNASFQEVLSKLGLQHVFAPPTAQSLERLKLARFLWAAQPELLDKAVWRAPDELDAAALTKRVAELPFAADHPARAAVAKPDLSSAAIAKRAGLALLLWSADPKAFFEWAKSDSSSTHGILPGSSGDYALNSALTKAGLKPEDAPKATPADAKKLFELGLLIKHAPSVAEDLVCRPMESVPPSKLEELIVGAGIDVSNERLAKLELREVYPGYFTAYDPQLPARLHEKGARYLYSTLDSPERVFEVLSGGQKSSMTRFSEGVLVQGKSSAADFGTGGAFSIFTRLVTDSVISKAKAAKKTGSSAGYGTNFHNWGGSRPYKIILNKSVLGRLDWYGYNGDNFGRSTGLKAANHGEAIVDTINKSYSLTNELMFPVGNDPKNIDFIVCENQQQKDKLIAFLVEKGVTTLRGRPLEDVVRIETSFFEHPDDITVESAVKDALEGFEVKAADAAARELAASYAKAHADAETKATALALADDALPAQLKSLIDSAGQSAATKEAKAAATTLTAALPAEIAGAALAAAKATLESTAKDPPESLVSGSRWQLENQLRPAVQKRLVELLSELGPAIAAEAAAKAKAEQPTDATPEQLKAAIGDAVKAALLGKGREAATQKLVEELAAQAETTVTTVLGGSAKNVARSTLGAPMNEAALFAGRAKLVEAGLFEGLQAQLLAGAKATVIGAVEPTVKGQLPNRLRSQIQTQTKPKVEEKLVAGLGDAPKQAARAAGLEAIKAKVQQAAEAFNAANPDKAVALDGPALEALTELGLARADAIAAWGAGAELGQAIDGALKAAVDEAIAAKTAMDHAPTIAARAEELLIAQLDLQLNAALGATLGGLTAAALDETAAARGAEWVAALAPKLSKELLAELAGKVPQYNLDAAIGAVAKLEQEKIS